MLNSNTFPSSSTSPDASLQCVSDFGCFSFQCHSRSNLMLRFAFHYWTSYWWITVTLCLTSLDALRLSLLLSLLRWWVGSTAGAAIPNFSLLPTSGVYPWSVCLSIVCLIDPLLTRTPRSCVSSGSHLVWYWRSAWLLTHFTNTSLRIFFWAIVILAFQGPSR